MHRSGKHILYFLFIFYCKVIIGIEDLYVHFVVCKIMLHLFTATLLTLMLVWKCDPELWLGGMTGFRNSSLQ